MKNRILSFTFVALLLGGSVCMNNTQKTEANALKETPMSISEDHVCYELDKSIDTAVNTYAAWIKVPSNVPSGQPVGIIIGNHHYDKYFEGSTGIAIDSNGHLVVYWNCLSYNYTFYGADLRNDALTHVAIVRNKDAKTLNYYVNGNLIESVNVALVDNICPAKYRIGMDQSSWYIDYFGRLESPFLGEIKSVALFESALSASQVKGIKNSDYYTEEDFPGIITALNFDNWGNQVKVKDTMKNIDAHLVSFNKAVPVEDNSEYDYSFIVVPDMQAMTYWNQLNFYNQAEWIVNNVEDEKIKFVMYLGDMVESKFAKGGVDAQNNDTEWETATLCIKQLNDVVPYSVVIGNHDYDDWVQASRSATQFNKYFPQDEMENLPCYGGVYEDGCMENSYYVVNVNGIEYLIFALEEAPRTRVLKWIDRVIEEHPDARVFATTHSYVSPLGDLDHPGGSNGYPSKTITYGDCNDGLLMWQKCLSKHANVLAVFSGHQCSDDIIYRTDKGIYGNTVHSFLVDFQGSMLTNAMNTVMRVRVNEAKKTMSICAYWIDKDMCFNMQNQFVINFADQFNPNVGK